MIFCVLHLCFQFVETAGFGKNGVCIGIYILRGVRVVGGRPYMSIPVLGTS